jgi:hypothetical protein
MDENTLMKKAVSMIGRKFYKATLNETDYEVKPDEADINNGNLIGSATQQGTHAPVFDLDFPAYLLPSSSPGKFHLYLEKEISWESYLDILESMVNAGLLEPGWVDSGITNGAMLLRPPGVFKENVKSLNHVEKYEALKSRHEVTLCELKSIFLEWQKHKQSNLFIDEAAKSYIQSPSAKNGATLFLELFNIVDAMSTIIEREKDRLKYEQERTTRQRTYIQGLEKQITDMGEIPLTLEQMSHDA